MKTKSILVMSIICMGFLVRVCGVEWSLKCYKNGECEILKSIEEIAREEGASRRQVEDALLSSISKKVLSGDEEMLKLFQCGEFYQAYLKWFLKERFYCVAKWMIQENKFEDEKRIHFNILVDFINEGDFDVVGFLMENDIGVCWDLEKENIDRNCRVLLYALRGPNVKIVELVFYFIFKYFELWQLDIQLFAEHAVLLKNKAVLELIAGIVEERKGELDYTDLLYTGVKVGDEEIVRYIVEKGGDVNGFKEGKGKVMDYAISGGYYKVINILIENGAEMSGYHQMWYGVMWFMHHAKLGV